MATIKRLVWRTILRWHANRMFWMAADSGGDLSPYWPEYLAAEEELRRVS